MRAAISVAINNEPARMEGNICTGIRSNASIKLISVMKKQLVKALKISSKFF
jgi:hypothetical protein